MSGFGRITQEVVEVIGPDQGSGRVTQLYAEAIGPPGGTARITQLYTEAIGFAADSARVTQLYVEPIGPPGSNARITQLYLEPIGPPKVTACILPIFIHFHGNVSGEFYVMEAMGGEVIPVPFVDTNVTINPEPGNIPTQFIVSDGQWVNYNPQVGPLLISFSNGAPVRTIWILTNLARSNPPSLPIWASSQSFSLWKQTCTVPAS